ncbi:outer membrane protein assembly factor BamB family protein [Phaeovulum vinaykumarii]|uniref:outer membrane protein assembly factor BamB family protein n=1 Tax=Phaeovulum vinaykumarii TaxID=407234 RepID=UPI001179D901|nr:PQQ-like beta-propeller repeat protein [Phaeovulum vinaykumarii]
MPGIRLDPREALDLGVNEAPAPAAEAARVPLALPAPQARPDWPQRAGGPDHDIGHRALSPAPQVVWTAPIGAGEGRRRRMPAQPVVSGGRIFTLDAEAQLTATSTAGATLWSVDLTPPGEKKGEASGGGIAVAGNRVFVTSAYGVLEAFDATTGARLWEQDFDAPVGGAPTVADGRVHVLARDGSVWAVEAGNGKVVWQQPGLPGRSGVTGASAPAVSGGVVVFPFATGDLLALEAATGAPKWQGRIAGRRIGRAFAAFTDVTGDPVIAGGRVYAGSSSGRTVAIEAATGQPLWNATEGTSGPVTVAGGSVFLVSDEGRLLRLDAATGDEIWAVELPYYVKAKIKKQSTIYVHYGPVLAGGKLWLASSDGIMRAFDPVTGAPAGQIELPEGAASAPVVAGGVAYVQGVKGDLIALR